MTFAPLDFAARAMDARLQRDVTSPLAVAFSGGGDSLALLLFARDWAERAGRKLLALTVDHRLQKESADWARWCADRAARLDVAHLTLVWEEAKPGAGLPAAARHARHRLIAQTARAAGARVVLFGHTADDVLESRLMRGEGHNITAPKLWAPSPVWPEGRGVFLLRPLIAARRADLRTWLSGLGESWIEDPANADWGRPRTRARARLVADDRRDGDEESAADGPAHGLERIYGAARIGPAGEISADLGRLAHAGGSARFLAAAISCVSGKETPPRGRAIRRLTQRMGQGGRFAATLGGARIACDAGLIVIARETLDRRGQATSTLALVPGEVQVFDGRFEARASTDGLFLRSVGGLAARLAPHERARFACIHPMARAALPALVDAEGEVSCPTLAPDARVEMRGLVGPRLAGAFGRINTEADLAAQV